MAKKFGYESETWNRYDLTDKNGNDIMDRVAALETKMAAISGGDSSIFPIGTVLCFADDSIKATTLHEKYGGVWKLFGQGRTLVGAVWDSYSSKGYSSKMATANTVYDPPGQSYAKGYTDQDSPSQHDAGTAWSLTPESDEWYAKMDSNSLVGHSHTGVEVSPGHWHKVWNRQQYSSGSPDSHYIYQNDGGTGSDTRKSFLEISTKVDKFGGKYGNTLATDYPVNGTETSEGKYSKESLVHIVTDTAGNTEPKLGTWQPYITVWFYKRIE